MRMPDKSLYTIRDAEKLYSPALVYFYDIIVRNTKKVIEIAGDTKKLWPHIKTHKMSAMLALQIDEGITRFKCSTLTELETAAKAGASDALLSYPLVGPNIERFINLQKNYPSVRLWATGDDYTQFMLLSDAAKQTGIKIPVVVDVNVGMNRTGVKIGQNTIDLYEKTNMLPGIELRGLHCYDGHIHDENPVERERLVSKIYGEICTVRKILRERGFIIDTIIAGGTPSFPCYAKIADPDFYFSPGTVFVYDFGYYSHYADLDLLPGAVILSRVVSTPDAETFTIDTGYKAISSDPTGIRGLLLELPDAQSVSQNEEHWIFKKSPAMELPRPGRLIRIIPTHICPTTALYPFAYMVKNGAVCDKWDVSARNRE